MKYITILLAGVLMVLSASCGTLPERQEHKGPVSSESTIPWNSRQPGDNTGGIFSGLSSY